MQHVYGIEEKMENVETKVFKLQDEDLNLQIEPTLDASNITQPEVSVEIYYLKSWKNYYDQGNNFFNFEIKQSNYSYHLVQLDKTSGKFETLLVNAGGDKEELEEINEKLIDSCENMLWENEIDDNEDTKPKVSVATTVKLISYIHKENNNVSTGKSYKKKLWNYIY